MQIQIPLTEGAARFLLQTVLLALKGAQSDGLTGEECEALVFTLMTAEDIADAQKKEQE